MKKRLTAISTLELLTAVFVLAILLTAGYQVFKLSTQTVRLAQDYARAEVLARDLLEITVSKRNEDWNIINPGTYHFQIVDGDYQFVAGTEQTEYFTRGITISTVQRDVSGNIVESGGSEDVDVFKLTSVVSWDYRGKNHQVELEQYITNWRRF